VPNTNVYVYECIFEYSLLLEQVAKQVLDDNDSLRCKAESPLHSYTHTETRNQGAGVE